MALSIDIPPPLATKDQPRKAPFGAWARPIFAVALMEWRLSVRSPSFWILFGVSTLLAWAEATSSGLDYVQGALNIFINTQLVLFPLLVARTVMRDRVRRITPLVLSRPLATIDYIAGQWLGCLSICWLVLLWMFWATIGYWKVTGHTVPNLSAALLVLPTLALAGMVITSWAMFWTRLIPIPQLGALLGSASLIYLVYKDTMTLVRPLNLTLDTAYFSSSIGYGPDAVLIGWQWGITGGIALAVLAAAMFVGQWRQRQGAFQLRHILFASAIAASAASVLAVSVVGFLPAAALRTAALGPNTTVLGTSQVDRYVLDAAIDPDKGTFAGTASFRIDPGAMPTNRFMFGLNPGLVVTHLQLGDRPLRDHAARGWHVLDLTGTPIAHGQAALLTVVYRGTLTLPREDYTDPAPGLTFGLFHTGLSHGAIPVTDYVGQGVAFLEQGGDWYPRPWVEGMPTTYYRGNAFDRITLTFPAGTTVRASIGTIETRGASQVLHAEPNSILPQAFVAALTEARTVIRQGTRILVRGLEPDPITLQSAADLAEFAGRIDHWLGDGASTWQPIVLPMLKSPQVGPGIIFVPEYSSLGYLNDNYLNSNQLFSLGPLAYGSLPEAGKLHLLAQLVAEGWWSQLLSSTYSIPYSHGGGNFFNIPADATYDAGDGRIIFSPNTDVLPTLLAEYTAGTITADRVGAATLEQERQIRKAFLDALNAQQSMGNQSRGNDDPYGQSSRKMTTAGLAILGFRDPGQQVLAFYDLQDQIGRETLTMVIRDYLTTHRTVAGSLADFILFVNKRTGHDFGALLAPYTIARGGQG